MTTISLYTKPVPINQKNSVIRGRVYLSKKYREAKNDLKEEVAVQYDGELLEEDLCLNVLFYFGDRRRRDIDAYLKIIMDSMEGIVYKDDVQVNELHVFKVVDTDNPRTEVQVLA